MVYCVKRNQVFEETTLSIVKIDIDNYKSIKNCSMKIQEIVLLIGENGCGKSNILSAIKFFYDNLLIDCDDYSMFDNNNKFNDCIKISITYDLTNLRIKSLYQLKKRDHKYSSFYNKIISMASCKDNLFTVTLIKIKNKKNQWINASLSDRKMIYNLFPLYVVDSRNINLTNWDDLWHQIGDLVKLERNLQRGLVNDLKKVILNDEKYKLKDNFNKLETAFLNSNIEIKNYTPKQLASLISKMYFNGDEFIFKENKLNYYSNGTNALNYTCVIIEILLMISIKKMKSPIIFIDEPEISLHHTLIDVIFSKIFKSCDKIRFIISTHSTRLLKNTLRYDKENSHIYHVKIINNYTQVSKFRLFNDHRLKNFIDDQNVNAYFAKTIVGVEGESEIELFSNRFLLEVFPFIKEIEFIKATSNDTVVKIISPKMRNYNTPCIFIYDMDKVLVRELSENKFKLRNKNFVRNYPNEEKYYYTQYRKEQSNLRKRILKMVENLRLHYEFPLMACYDKNYEAFIYAIKKYHKKYNIFIAETTTEGMLINEGNLKEFYAYAENNIKTNNSGNMKDLFDSLDIKNKVIFLRFLYQGKNEFLMKFNEVKNKNLELKVNLKEFIETNINSKTMWISDWIEYYFCHIINLDPKNKDSFKKFIFMLNNNEKSEFIRNKFMNDFEELYDLIEMMKEKHTKGGY